MEIEYQISMELAEARKRIEALGDYLNNRHGIAVRWEGDTAHFHGRYLMIRFEGAMTLDGGVARFRGKDPGMLLRNKARNYIQSKMAMYLNPETPLEELPRQ